MECLVIITKSLDHLINEITMVTIQEIILPYIPFQTHRHNSLMSCGKNVAQLERRLASGHIQSEAVIATICGETMPNKF